MNFKWLISIMTVVFLIVGCSKDDEKKDVSQITNETKEQVVTDTNMMQMKDEEKENTDSKSDLSDDLQENTQTQMEQNQELTKQVKEEDGVIDGQVYEQDGMAIGTLLLEKNVSDKEAKRLAEKYIVELKKEYKDAIVNVQAVRDGKNIVNITKE
jgi:Sec-independent protein translocase protein TatA